MIESIIGGILSLLGTASFVIVVALLLFKTSIIKPSRRENSLKEEILISIVFGILAIYATLMGSVVGGAILNVRELASLMAGLMGGPISGLLAGLIGGIHRYSVGGLTALPCSVSTILAGVIAGIVSNKIAGKAYLLKGAVLAFCVESGAMALILLLAQPFSQALKAVEQIAVPMITATTIGLVIFLFLAQSQKPTI